MALTALLTCMSWWSIPPCDTRRQCDGMQPTRTGQEQSPAQIWKSSCLTSLVARSECIESLPCHHSVRQHRCFAAASLLQRQT